MITFKFTEKNNKINKNAISVIQTLKDKGFDALLVGGCVRDLMIGRTPKDWDIATNATPDEVEEIFPDTVPVGKNFGVIVVVMDDGEIFEVATFRKDIGGNGRRPDSVEFCTFVEDAKRRDFTINSMGLDSITLEVTDVVGAMDDLTSRTIRFIGDPEQRIEEDKLRMLRAFRFMGQLGFTIEKVALGAIVQLAPKILEVSQERIFAEMSKILLTPHPDRILRLMKKSGILHHILPELTSMSGLEQPANFHPEGDVWEHTMRVVQKVRGMAIRGANGLIDDDCNILMWAALLHDVGKIKTQEIHEDGKITFHGHDSLGAKIVREDIMPRLKVSASIRDGVADLVKKHMIFCQVSKMKKSTFKKLARKDDGKLLDLLIILHTADALASSGDLSNLAEVELRKSEIPPDQPLDAIFGRDLIDVGFKPGKGFGVILSVINEAVLNELIPGRMAAIEIAMLLFITSIQAISPGEINLSKQELSKFVKVLIEKRSEKKDSLNIDGRWGILHNIHDSLLIIVEATKSITEENKNVITF